MATATDTKPQPDPPSPTAPPGDKPAYRRPGLIALFVVIAAALLTGDLVFKSWSFANVADQPVTLDGATVPDIPYHQPTTVIPNTLALQLTLNEGALFGMGQGNRWLFVVISIAAVGIISWMFASTLARQHWTQTALALILAGALGNMVDRVLYGAVRDMLYLFPGVSLPNGWSWPGGQTEVYPWIFNLADVFLVVGLAMLALGIFFAPKPPKKSKPNPAV